MEHIIKLPLKGHISILTNNDLKHIDPTEAYQIQIISRVMDHIMDLEQNTEEATRLQLTVPSVSPGVQAEVLYALGTHCGLISSKVTVHYENEVTF